MATTINAANLSIGMDLTKLKQGMGASRAEISQLQGMMRDAQTPAERYTQKLQLLERALKSGAITTDQYEKAQRALADKFNMNANQVSGLAGGFMRLAPQITAAAAAYKGFQIIQEGFSLAAAKEQVLAQFEVLTGSLDVTKRLVADFERLDKASPINVTAFQEAGKVLLGFGVSTGEITPTLERLSEISMGSEEKFQSLALAFGQVSANGRLMGQEVLQMINAGFNPLQEISRTTGTSMAELKKQMEAGKVTAEMVAAAFASATSEGGRFNDMNEKMATTTSVKMSKLANEWQMFKRSLGESVTPGINNALDGMTNMIENTRSFGPWFKEFWATATGNANKFNAERENLARIEAQLADHQKREQAQLEENNRLAKERADIEAQIAREQEARVQAEEKRVASAQEAFYQRTVSEFEKMQRATMGDDAFERNRIMNPGFEMTSGERQQAAAMLDNMAETKRQKALQQLRAETEASQKRLQDEAQILEMRNKGIFSSDEARRKAIETERAVATQKAAEQERLAARLAEIERQRGNDPAVTQSFIDRAKRDSEFRMEQIDNAAKEALAQIGMEDKLGNMEQRRSALEAERQRIMGTTGPNVAATIAPAIRAGTIEAYRATNQQNEQRAARQEQVAELKRINTQLEKLNDSKAIILKKAR